MILEFMFFFFIIWVSFEKLKSFDNQTWVKDEIVVSSYGDEVNFDS